MLCVLLLLDYQPYTLLNEPEINDINIKLDFFTILLFLSTFMLYSSSFDIFYFLFSVSGAIESAVKIISMTSVVKIDRPEPVFNNNKANNHFYFIRLALV